MTEPLRLSFRVNSTVEHSFRVWTTQISLWWPADHTVSVEAGLDVVIEPWVGGRVFERTADGTEHDWGRVTVWDPPSRLTYLWHLRRDRADATLVDITFVDGGDATTQIDIRHVGWDRLGIGGQATREANQAGWASLLPHYIGFIDSELSTVDSDGKSAHE